MKNEAAWDCESSGQNSRAGSGGKTFGKLVRALMLRLGSF